MKKEDMLQTLSFLAIKMENSGTQLLEAVAPKSLIHLDPALAREKHKGDTNNMPELSFKEVNGMVRRIKKLGDFLSIPPIQAALMVTIFSRKFQDKLTGWDHIRQFFDVKSIVLIPLKKDFDQLIADKYLLTSGIKFSNSYDIAPPVIEAVMSGKKLNPQDLNDSNYDRYKFVYEISGLVKERSSEQFSTKMLFEKAYNVEQKHAEMTFVQQVHKLNMNIEERVLFYEICNDFLGYGASGLDCTLSDIYQYPAMRFRVSKMLMDKSHTLLKNDFIELLPGRMISESHLTLSEKGKQLFLENDYELFADDRKRYDILLYPDQISEKQLFYDAELERHLQLFRQNLEDEKFVELQKRLQEKAMPKGLIALFYGLPGTGKTETAMQIAKATGRPVYHVDIAASKSCWFGESEKLIKRIFTDYAAQCKKNRVKPILLFNEADALFSKRKDSTISNVAQTENAIQNIILEEMEKLDGIMIATTNLVDNLDSAFARRFLFKIKFGQPTVEVKQSIWKSKLEWLSDEDCKTLAAKYDFSGGEIDNIVRKITMNEVLEGTCPNLACIEEFCRQEKPDTKISGSIGFKG